MKHRFFSQKTEVLEAVRYGMDWVNDSALEASPITQVSENDPSLGYSFDVVDTEADDNMEVLNHYVDADLAR